MPSPRSAAVQPSACRAPQPAAHTAAAAACQAGRPPAAPPSPEDCCQEAEAHVELDVRQSSRCAATWWG
eukprot:2819080-Lingulodinium_polyedra.AAC.1